MKLTMLVLALGAIATPALAQTQPAAGSNIGLTNYPAPKCDKPVIGAKKPLPLNNDQPSLSEAEGYNNEVKRYNAALKTYNAQMESFNACIQSYMANGNADMVRIRDALSSAAAAAGAN
jgi:hypothetical protein